MRQSVETVSVRQSGDYIGKKWGCYMYALDNSVREGFLRAKQDIESLRKENQELRTLILHLQEKITNGLPASKHLGEISASTG